MMNSLEQLQAQALSLSRSDRVRLLECLVTSLDADQELESAWDALADRREAESAAGTAASLPLEDVIARLEARFPG